MELLAELLKMVSIAGGIVAGVVAAYVGVKELGPNNAKTLVETAMINMSHLEDETERLRQEIKIMRKNLNELTALYEELEEESERNKVQMNAMRKTIARLEELVKVYREAFSALYDQLIDNDIRPAVERPER